jgi:serine-type D-Ala-D-Ala carboxypeptidase/endopeptidase (penicillin-binding protein 4)
MRRNRLVVLAGQAVGLLLFASVDVDASTTLARELRAALSNLPHAQTRAGACVIDLHTGREIFALNADEPLIPASTMKVFTMAAALVELGPTFEFRTILATDGRNLIVIGDGDPAIGDDRLARARNEPITAIFEHWARSLRDHAMTAIEGDLIIDESIFDEVRLHPTWEPADLGKWYAAPVGGLNFNTNCLDITLHPGDKVGTPVRVEVQPPASLINIVNQARTGDGTPILHHPPGTFEYRISGRTNKTWPFGSVAFTDPGLLFADTMRTILLREGVSIAGEIRRARVRKPDGAIPVGLPVVAVYRTPIDDALGRAGKNSQNLFAECLIKRAGFAWANRKGCSEPQGSFDTGAQAVSDLLRRAEIAEGNFTVADGSGLSRDNQCTARQLTLLLAWSHRQPWGASLKENLAVAGVDGSLHKRIRDMPNRIFAKTGTMRGVRTLAGYIDGDNGPRYAFAVMFNGYRGPSTPYRSVQDRFCRLLAEAADTPP